MPMNREELQRLLDNAKLDDPEKVAGVLRGLVLFGLCEGLSDELLAELSAAVDQDETVPPPEVLEVVTDRWQVVVLCECMMTIEGRAEVFEAVDLELNDRANPNAESV